MNKIIIVLLFLFEYSITLYAQEHSTDTSFGVARLNGIFTTNTAKQEVTVLPKHIVLTEPLFGDTLLTEVTKDGRFSFIMPAIRPMLCILHLENGQYYVYLSPNEDTMIDIPTYNTEGIKHSNIKVRGKYTALSDMWNNISHDYTEYKETNNNITKLLQSNNSNNVSYLDSLSNLLQDNRIKWCPEYHNLCQRLIDIHYFPNGEISDDMKVRWLKKHLWNNNEDLNKDQTYSAMKLSREHQLYIRAHAMHIPARKRIISKDTTIIPYSNIAYNYTSLRGQLKSASKKSTVNSRDLKLHVIYNHSGFYQENIKTDKDGGFNINICNNEFEDDAVLLFSLKDKKQKRYYITIDSIKHQHERVGKEAIIANNTDCIRYDVDSAVDNTYNSGQKIPRFLDWLFNKDKKFQGTYGYLEPNYHLYNENNHSFDPDGPTYDKRPVIWFLNNKFVAITGKRSSNIDYRAAESTKEKLTFSIDDVHTVYISQQDGVWRPWFKEDNLSLIKPATVFIYTYPQSLSGKNIIRKIHTKTY